MPVKRRNAGRSQKNRGHTRTVPCTNCGRQVAKDKAVKRYTVRDMVDPSSKRDIQQKLAFENEKQGIPKLYVKLQYCISCAIHSRVVRVRCAEDRRIRRPPIRNRKPQVVKTDATAPKKQ
uniref:40S ribosomal protein S26 n=1 Tax=Tetrahymena thermophila TaxID=5911 RepID=E6PBU4_TETTH|nr:Chain 5, Ribosomal Protein S26e Containing Protein [Tetrahymena thermophila]4BPN_5 Chain 5, 40s Ribosomal Protein Rps26e [Tetrahymena thermophila]4BPO_5 Chain 5, 40s Ribosomal Protein Rps26e [Tetrahymena thermophila]4BTS_A5 Chain A5, 40S RIBOSOMAL PROTEIN RPS26E [Tetrahymena thermophila]4BTS_B5 Chain B5, 40S RIBOSOMAL PROTEIN RPS26E [Tetrahymena thermophila]4BTS_C5 Chain C5, 40S RIBOSOMAL PROTEIN RPS26E [Tetrahymena thermophila]4BTS_D5 Chain D5, 40S RIBOSOMAL PROTEIN RPS26E [Tetrahymena th